MIRERRDAISVERLLDESYERVIAGACRSGTAAPGPAWFVRGAAVLERSRRLAPVQALRAARRLACFTALRSSATAKL